MAKQRQSRIGKEPWSLAPLWIRTSDKQIVRDYVYKTDDTINNYICTLIEKDISRIKKELGI